MFQLKKIHLKLHLTFRRQKFSPKNFNKFLQLIEVGLHFIYFLLKLGIFLLQFKFVKKISKIRRLLL